MKILVACEYSGRVRDAFIAGGHDAMSCDLLPTDVPGKHYQGDVRGVLMQDWDMIIAFPPCTHLAVSGARWFKEKVADGRQQQGIDFFMEIANADCERIAIENPVGIMSTKWRKPDQIIQPWQFGHGETKATCLWLKGLAPLEPTNIVDGRDNRIHRMAPGPDRSKQRSLTFHGIADAMATQWSNTKQVTT
jgi:site-specific DNA-cytosine methylase